jgi:O-antigen/teichoic acid export membrane protein
MATVNLVLSVFLCQSYGAVGAAIGTAISLIVANGIVMNIYYHKKCNINILYFWKNILKMLLGIIIPIILGIVILI